MRWCGLCGHWYSIAVSKLRDYSCEDVVSSDSFISVKSARVVLGQVLRVPGPDQNRILSELVEAGHLVRVSKRLFAVHGEGRG